MKIEDDPLMSISDFAQRSGVNASALRFYESLGLIESARSGGRRRYHRGLRRIAYIVFAQRVGFTLEEIAAQLARLPTRHVPHAATGRRCRASGSSGWTSASTSCSACATASTSA
jgi:MerR family redox-sensitive transcriptional activator SoxR